MPRTTRGQHHPHADADLVRDGGRVGPLALADLVIQARERKGAFGHAVAGGVRLQRDGDHAIARDAFERQLARDLVAAVANAADRRRREMRDRKLRRVEPQRSARLGLRIRAREIDAREVDVDVGLRLVERRGIEHDVGLPLLEAAVEVDAHLLHREGNLALADDDPGGGRQSGHEERRGAQPCKQASFHGRLAALRRRIGNMRARTVSRSTK
jgi:hypothetical protein